MIVELIFVPGTTIVGILGFAVCVYGVYTSFQTFGSTTGWITLGVTSLMAIAFTVYSFKSNTWDRFALKGSIKSKVNEDNPIAVVVGDEGVTASSIKPIGKAEFHNRIYEVRSMGNYIVENEPVKVIKIDNNRIFVQTINS